MFDEIAYRKAYRAKHRARLNSNSRAWWACNKERQSLRKKIYYKTHPDKFIELNLKKSIYSRQNRDKANSSNRRWEQKVNGTPEYRLMRGKATAKYRDLEWTLSLHEYMNLLSKTCEYCDGGLPAVGVGLDRMDSGKGYLPENVVPCCTLCNRAKNNVFNYEEMKIAMRAVKEFRLKQILADVKEA